MLRAVLTQVLEIVDRLEPDELREVEQAVQRRLRCVDENSAMAAFHRALLESGLISEIRPAPTVDRERPLVPIQGKPLSETIIEERR